MILRSMICLIAVQAIIPAGSGVSAGELSAGPCFPAFSVAEADTTGRETARQDWSPDEIKQLLEKETGEPDIEGSTWKRKKNPRTAMLCSLAFPGLGQIYNERPFKAVVALGVQTFYIMNILHNHRMASDKLEERDGYERYVPCGDQTCLNPDWRIANAWYEEYKERTIDWVWWTAAAYLIVMLDAYVDAHLHDMQFRVEASSAAEGGAIAVVVDF